MTRLVASGLLTIAIAGMAGCGTDLSFGPPFPNRITAPEVIGLVESRETNPDLSSRIVLEGGEELVLRRQDHILQGGGSDLLLYGTHPENWYLSPSFNEGKACYVISASRAFSEDATVVLAFGRWPGVGVRLPKAPAFDDSRLVTRDAEGRLEYSKFGSVVSFCSDAAGRLSGFQ